MQKIFDVHFFHFIQRIKIKVLDLLVMNKGDVASHCDSRPLENLQLEGF